MGCSSFLLVDASLDTRASSRRPHGPHTSDSASLNRNAPHANQMLPSTACLPSPMLLLSFFCNSRRIQSRDTARTRRRKNGPRTNAHERAGQRRTAPEPRTHSTTTQERRTQPRTTQDPRAPRTKHEPTRSYGELASAPLQYKTRIDQAQMSSRSTWSFGAKRQDSNLKGLWFDSGLGHEKKKKILREISITDN